RPAVSPGPLLPSAAPRGGFVPSFEALRDPTEPLRIAPDCTLSLCSPPESANAEHLRECRHLLPHGSLQSMRALGGSGLSPRSDLPSDTSMGRPRAFPSPTR